MASEVKAEAVGQREFETVMLAVDGCVFEILAMAIGRNPKAPVDQIGSFESIRGQARSPALARVD